MTRWLMAVVSLGLVASTGCAVTFSRRSAWDVQRLAELSDELERFKTLAKMGEQETGQLEQAKTLLESHVSSNKVNVGYDERGLVTRFMDQVLFNSGKAQLRFGAFGALGQVAAVLREEVPDQPISIEGHTDNEPIKHSGWASNEELSVARADAVADYLVKQQRIDRNRLTVIGYGEARPITGNDTPEGRQKNRRVEIIILPQALERSLEDEAQRVLEGRTEYSK